MQLTPKQIEFLIDFANIFIYTVGVMTIIREVFRLIKIAIKKIAQGIRRMSIRRQVKHHNGYKNFKDNTWYTDGTMYRTDKEKFEKADFTSKK